MSELSEDKKENFSLHVTKSDQPAYIKIETLCGNIVSINHTWLKEVCGNATLNRSNIKQWHKCFGERKVNTEDNPQSGHPPTVTDTISIVIRIGKKSIFLIFYQLKSIFHFQSQSSNFETEVASKIIVEFINLNKSGRVHTPTCASVLPSLQL